MSQTAPEGGAKKLKDWFDGQVLRDLAGRFSRQMPAFDSRRFLTLAGDGLEAMEMMDRVRHIAAAMGECFPGPTSRDMEALIASMGPPLPHLDDGTGMVGSSYYLWPLGEFIGQSGLDDWDASWQAMEELTQRLTSEFAVRPFLAADLPRGLSLFQQRLEHPSHHVRRWVSEGTRTRLPWGKGVPALRQALEPRLAFLEALKDDPSPYVRRSVANHLQDILKDDLPAGLVVLERWAALGDERVDWVVKHAARGLLKAGHPRVLALFGWDQPATLEQFRGNPGQLNIGGTVRLEAQVSNPGKRSIEARVDYRWQGPTPTGRRFSKVFRWTDVELGAGQSVTVTKLHPFFERSTRKLPLGMYEFTILVNGLALASLQVQLCREGAIEATAEPAGSTSPGASP